MDKNTLFTPYFNMNPLYTALNSVKLLRSSVGHVFETLENGLRADHGEEGKDTKFLLELQELLNTVNINFRDLEQAVNNLSGPPGPFNLGNSGFLSQESTLDRQALYPDLVGSYKWTDKAHEYANHAVSLFSANSLKRSYINSSSKRRRTQTSTHNVSPQAVDTIIVSIERQFHDMTLSISRPFAANAVVQVTLGRTLRALVAFRGLMIEWVVVKGFGETLDDLWTESRHSVFRKVTENAHAAMLHFYSPPLPELAVRSFMTWFHSYNTLFSEPCKRCGNYLHSALPATWRDFRTLEPFHEECKP